MNEELQTQSVAPETPVAPVENTQTSPAVGGNKSQANNPIIVNGVDVRQYTVEDLPEELADEMTDEQADQFIILMKKWVILNLCL